MPHIPANVQNLKRSSMRGGGTLEERFFSKGILLIHRGKVRDTYMDPNRLDKLIVVATDRVSIFDFVLPVTIDKKGEVLTALTHFWMTSILSEYPNHLVRSALRPRLNAVNDLEYRLQMSIPRERILVVEKLDMIPYELIFRAHLGGSVWKQYEKTGKVSGLEMPPGLHRWEKLRLLIFTPSTKAEEGHDVNISAADYFLAPC